MSARERYENELAALSSAVGGRNGRLVTVALHGVRAGYSVDRIAADLVERGGDPPLSVSEALRAARHAADRVGVELRVSSSAWMGKPVKPWRDAARDAATDVERGFVRRMIDKGDGASSRDLRAMSPIKIPALLYGEAAEFVQNIFPDWREKFYCGEAKGRRDESALHDPAAFLTRYIDKEEPLPPMVMPNPVTGEEGRTGDGRRSRVCLETVAAHRWAVVEFDDMDLKMQGAFWAGVVTTPAAGRPTALPVRSLVYSGGKSIHALLRLDAGDAAEFRAYWAKLARLLSSSEAQDERGRLFERCDVQCADAVRMTRLPGAWRPDKCKWQRLLWLSPSLPSEAGPWVWDYPRKAWDRPNAFDEFDVHAGTVETATA